MSGVEKKMIKLLGVATIDGLPVVFKPFVEIKDINTYVSGLLSAVSALKNSHKVGIPFSSATLAIFTAGSIPRTGTLYGLKNWSK